MFKLGSHKTIRFLLKRKIIRRSIDTLIWVATIILSEKHKQLIKSKLPLQIKEILKTLVSGEKFSARDQVNQIKYKLLNLGFEEKGYKELYELARNTSNSENIKKEAAWELALWHADQHTSEDAIIGLDFLRESLENVEDNSKLRQGCILQSELLGIIGKKEDAQSVVYKKIDQDSHPDLLLAAANLETSLEKKLTLINKLMRVHGLSEIGLNGDESKSLYDQLTTVIGSTLSNGDKGKQKVSVIMPVFNSEIVVETALRSVLGQTWGNIEFIIVDDCSTDSTKSIVQRYANQDNRIKLFSTGVNSGTYVARNIGLQAATGEFVTCHDADDWSHAEKIEKQVLHLVRNKKAIGNMSGQCRITEELFFYRRKQQRFFIFNNMSSLMFKRIEVLEHIGYWDNVRFGADGEFIRRIRKKFGDDSVVSLNTGPLSFPRVISSSLTESGAFGYNGFFFGARKEYVESFNFHHNQVASLKYEISVAKRPFPIPEPMKPDRVSAQEIRYFDVILVSDFRLVGGTTSSNIEEIKAQRQAGLRTGLIQLSSYMASGVKDTNTRIRDLIDGDKVQMLVYGEKVSCNVLIVRHPPILQEMQKYLPEVKADHVYVIVNQTPKVDYGENGRVAYDIERCQMHLEKYFGQAGIWYPISPLVRKTLNDHHADELSLIHLSDRDWVNIINVSEWMRESYINEDSKIRIGRHSRDQYVKWPSDPKQLREIYPDFEPYEIHILGGAKIPERTLGKLPNNWKVWGFGERESKDFLADLDVFVYYIHPDCVEAFGRVIIEAMAVGVPVILPYSYFYLFGEAAIYAEPNNVQEKIESLMKDKKLYELQIQSAIRYLRSKFDYSSHIRRLRL
ncbi:glycosyltransferase [Paenibacillus lautus]|uniref:glycosyltransferase n=1 Tax=Paenibacillus lautus TaxID=1401 RepID=UPI001C7E12D9|nr:glycosyltransferase [Paenibacillus lautus]MBX4145822.1 glycosyltransferase [Paenibacillus lautus]